MNILFNINSIANRLYSWGWLAPSTLRRRSTASFGHCHTARIQNAYLWSAFRRDASHWTVVSKLRFGPLARARAKRALVGFSLVPDPKQTSPFLTVGNRSVYGGRPSCSSPPLAMPWEASSPSFPLSPTSTSTKSVPKGRLPETPRGLGERASVGLPLALRVGRRTRLRLQCAAKQ